MSTLFLGFICIFPNFPEILPERKAGARFILGSHDWCLHECWVPLTGANMYGRSNIYRDKGRWVFKTSWKHCEVQLLLSVLQQMQSLWILCLLPLVSSIPLSQVYNMQDCDIGYNIQGCRLCLVHPYMQDWQVTVEPPHPPFLPLHKLLSYRVFFFSLVPP